MTLSLRTINYSGLILAAVVPVLLEHDGDPGRPKSPKNPKNPLAGFAVNAGHPCPGDAVVRFVVPPDRPERWVVELTGRHPGPLPSAAGEYGAAWTTAAGTARAATATTATQTSGTATSGKATSGKATSAKATAADITAWAGVLAVYAVPAGSVTVSAPPGGATPLGEIGATRIDATVDTTRLDAPRLEATRPEATLPEATRGEPIGVEAIGDDGVVDTLPPMIGHYEVDGPIVRFVPRYAPVAGVTYLARAAGAPDVRFALPTQGRGVGGAPTTRVTAIYPTSDRVPANLLKLHIEFSAPMRDGEAEHRLHLLDSGGRELTDAFLHVDEELWDASRRRLTVMFDPGRIKRGLRANLEEGAPLDQGRTFRLVIDGEWRDAHGLPIVARAEKRLIVEEADRASPDWRRWTVQSPRVGSRQPLTVQFDEPLDRTLLERWLIVTDAAGHRLAGQVVVGPQESSWSFVPAQPWSAEGHQVLVDPRIEDRAANRLTSLFDRDVSGDASGDVSGNVSGHVSADVSAGGAGVPHASRPASRSQPIALPFTPRPTVANGT